MMWRPVSVFLTSYENEVSRWWYTIRHLRYDQARVTLDQRRNLRLYLAAGSRPMHCSEIEQAS